MAYLQRVFNDNKTATKALSVKKKKRKSKLFKNIAAGLVCWRDEV